MHAVRFERVIKKYTLANGVELERTEDWWSPSQNNGTFRPLFTANSWQVKLKKPKTKYAKETLRPTCT